MDISQIISLLSGVALFLFGMTLMGDGLKRVSGNKLEPVLFKLTGTRFRGILLGAGVTAVIQSSSATSVMVVGFVNAGMMKIRQAIPVILGAILGTSITGWIICLSYIDGGGGVSGLFSTATITGLVAIVGILLRMFSKTPSKQHIGDILMGFAVLMFGMSNMSGAVSGLGEKPWFTSALTSMTLPIFGILAGIALSMILQSASAAVGIVQALSITGAMSLNSALPLLMGISIGASLPVLLSALGAGIPGKRTAVSYLVSTFMGVMVFASIFYIAHAIFRFSFMERIMDPFSLAFINTVMRLVIICLLAPFVDVLEAIAAVLVPDGPKNEKDPALRLEDRFLNHPALAIEQGRLVIGEMAEKTQEAIREASLLLDHYSVQGFERVKELEDEGDLYEDALGSYLVRLASQELSERQSREASKFLHTLSDFERISDHAMNIAKSAREMFEKQMHFSEEAIRDLRVMEEATMFALRITVESFNQDDFSLAEQVEPMEEVIDDICDEAKLRHVERLQKGLCTIHHGFVFNDLVTNYERVSDHCSNIAVAMIELDEGTFDTHEYLTQIREQRSPEFEQYYRKFRKQFAL